MGRFVSKKTHSASRSYPDDVQVPLAENEYALRIIV